MSAQRPTVKPSQTHRRWPWALAGGFALAAGGAWLLFAIFAAACPGCAAPAPRALPQLQSAAVASMDSPLFTYSPGWRVTSAGAEPTEPAHPFVEPAGVITFPYSGQDLFLLLAPGDYWAYLYVTVDGQPANQLPAIPGNPDSTGSLAGYQTLFAPERAAGASGEHWVHVHRAANADAPHTVRIEVWRGWGQTPVRGVAIDLPATALLDPTTPARADAPPLWPAVLLLAVGGWVLAFALWPAGTKRADTPRRVRPRVVSDRIVQRWAPVMAAAGLAAVAAGTVLQLWPLCTGGVALLALAGIFRPALWLAALLFALPFYFAVKLPLLPNRTLDLIDVGVLGGVVVVFFQWLVQRLVAYPGGAAQQARRHARSWPLLFLALLVTWALVATVSARYPAIALREWRTVFLNALLFGGTLALMLRLSAQAAQDRWLLVAAWLAGAAVVSVAGLWGFAGGDALVSPAEGVRRIQAFYGSANNLALYLDRTVAVALALAIFSRTPRTRLLWALLAAPQGLALLLTFSKGSLFLALPVTMLTLGVGGIWLLRQEGRSIRPILVLGGVALAGMLVILPFAGAERFQRLFDLSQGTGFLRLQLWRSAGQMALDHPLLGVGPDQFLYHYRSNYLLPTGWQEPNLNHPHNLFLDWWTRLGLPGLLLGLAWLGSGGATVVRWLRRGQPKALALGVLTAIAAALAHGLIDISYALPDLMVVWVLLFGLDVDLDLVDDYSTLGEFWDTNSLADYWNDSEPAQIEPLTAR